MTPHARDRAGWTDRVAVLAGSVTIAGMIATPLFPQRGAGRKVLSSVVVGGMFITTTVNAIRKWGPVRAGVGAGGTAIVTAAIEHVGTTTGRPFGRYAYSATLQPQVAGVPVIVPLAWFGMALPAREAAHAALGRHTRPATRIALGSLAMTAWDLFLDPQMVGEGYWAWVKRGAYRGIPLSNFLGWLVTGLGIMAMLEVVLPHRDQTVDGRLTGEYQYMAVMQTLGFARYFRDPVVAAVGGSAMLSVAAASGINTLRQRRQ